MKKLFGGINLTWKKLVLFAIITAIYTALINQVPFLKDTSFRDIAISFEWWILFGTIIIMNSKNNLDSALKCFVFFLISQPLIYLIEVPFLGWQIMSYYRLWIVWTLLCIPMGFVGYYLKKDKWYGLLILTPIIFFLGYHLSEFITMTLFSFPRHLLSTLFCIITMIIFPLYIYKDKKIKKIGLIISIITILLCLLLSLTNRHVYETEIFCSSEEHPLNTTYKVYLKDKKYGDVSVIKDENLDDYCLHAKFIGTGKTELIIESNGKKQVYDLTIKNNTYDYKLKK